MRTSLTFWQMPYDEAAYLDYLRSTGVVRMRDHRSLLRSEPIEFQPLSAFRRKGSGLPLLCRKCDLDEVKIYNFRAEGKLWHTVDPSSSPVLTYARERPNRGQLHYSTVGAALDFVDLRTGQRRQKDASYKKWAKAVVGFWKTHCTETANLYGFGYPATPEVIKAVTAGTIELRI